MVRYPGYINPAEFARTALEPYRSTGPWPANGDGPVWTEFSRTLVGDGPVQYYYIV